jgi:hypothetical protein
MICIVKEGRYHGLWLEWELAAVIGSSLTQSGIPKQVESSKTQAPTSREAPTFKIGRSPRVLEISDWKSLELGCWQLEL